MPVASLSERRYIFSPFHRIFTVAGTAYAAAGKGPDPGRGAPEPRRPPAPARAGAPSSCADPQSAPCAVRPSHRGRKSTSGASQRHSAGRLRSAGPGPAPRPGRAVLSEGRSGRTPHRHSPPVIFPAAAPEDRAQRAPVRQRQPAEPSIGASQPSAPGRGRASVSPPPRSARSACSRETNGAGSQSGSRSRTASSTCAVPCARQSAAVSSRRRSCAARLRSRVSSFAPLPVRRRHAGRPRSGRRCSAPSPSSSAASARQLTYIGKPQIVPFRPHRAAQRQRPRAALPEAQHEPPPRPERPGLQRRSSGRPKRADRLCQLSPHRTVCSACGCSTSSSCPVKGSAVPFHAASRSDPVPCIAAMPAQRLSRQNGVDHRTHLLPAYAQHFDSAIRA